ncbi:MAG: OsmC family peroxiredoxin [Bacteroidota bacterium]
MKRKATAQWQGAGKTGKGQLTTDSGVLKGTNYNFNTRFEDGAGTNPEELIAAAHAGCFSMKLSFVLNEAGFTTTSIETRCEIDFKEGIIAGSHLVVNAEVDGISKEQFDTAVKEAALNCPISKLLNTAITFEAELTGAK